MRDLRALALMCTAAIAVGCSGSSSSSVTLADHPGAQARVTVRSAITGKVRWTAEVPGRCGRVSAAGARYFVINEQVLDRQTGRWLWHAGGAAGVRGASRGTDGDVAPVVGGPTIIVLRHGALQGRDPRTGRVRWTRRQRWFAPPPGALAPRVAVGPSTVVVGRSEAPGR